MVKPIIYGSERSPAVRGVLLVSHALGLDYEFQQINTQKGEHLTEEFLKKNPQHTIPTLEDSNGKCIWDSHAIVTYLASKYGKNDALYPKDLFDRAVINQRLHFDSSVLGARISAYGAAARAQDPEQVEKSYKSLQEAYDFLEKFLGNNQYLAGNHLTVADLSLVASISTINAFVPMDKEKCPKLVSWLTRMENLPYYEEANNKGLQAVIEYFKEMLKTAGKA